MGHFPRFAYLINSDYYSEKVTRFVIRQKGVRPWSAPVRNCRALSRSHACGDVTTIRTWTTYLNYYLFTIVYKSTYILFLKRRHTSGAFIETYYLNCTDTKDKSFAYRICPFAEFVQFSRRYALLIKLNHHETGFRFFFLIYVNGVLFYDYLRFYLYINNVNGTVMIKFE